MVQTFAWFSWGGSPICTKNICSILFILLTQQCSTIRRKSSSDYVKSVLLIWQMTNECWRNSGGCVFRSTAGRSPFYLLNSGERQKQDAIVCSSNAGNWKIYLGNGVLQLLLQFLWWCLLICTNFYISWCHLILVWIWAILAISLHLIWISTAVPAGRNSMPYKQIKNGAEFQDLMSKAENTSIHDINSRDRLKIYWKQMKPTWNRRFQIDYSKLLLFLCSQNCIYLNSYYGTRERSREKENERGSSHQNSNRVPVEEREEQPL